MGEHLEPTFLDLAVLVSLIDVSNMTYLQEAFGGEISPSQFYERVSITPLRAAYRNADLRLASVGNAAEVGSQTPHGRPERVISALNPLPSMLRVSTPVIIAAITIARQRSCLPMGLRYSPWVHEWCVFCLGLYPVK